jgi:hypothetical protein
MKEGKSKNSSLFAFSQIPSSLLVVNNSNLTLSIFVVSREGLAPIVKAYSRLILVDGLVL